MLMRIDLFLGFLGLAVALCLAAHCLRRSRGLRLTDVPWQGNRFGPEVFLSAVLAYFCGYFIVGSLVGTVGREDPPLRAVLAAGIAAQLACVATIAVLGSRGTKGGFGVFFLGEKQARSISSWAATAAVAVISLGCIPYLYEFTLWAIHQFDPSWNMEPHATLKALSDESQPRGIVWALWFGAVIAAPLTEEGFFRGVFQTVLVNAIRSRWAGILGASVLFGLSHAGQPESVPALIVFGIVLGVLYDRTGSLLLPILVHALFNLRTLVWHGLVGSTET